MKGIHTIFGLLPGKPGPLHNAYGARPNLLGPLAFANLGGVLFGPTSAVLFLVPISVFTGVIGLPSPNDGSELIKDLV